MKTFKIAVVVSSLMCVIYASDTPWGGLYPRESESREVRSLDGIWNFRLSPINDPEKGFREHWFAEALARHGAVQSMPVPSSYNDVSEDRTIRDHIGWAWYDRTFYVPGRWQQDDVRVVLRLGSAHYNSIIYLNGKVITSHFGGHLPIMAEVSDYLVFNQENLITVAINNTLTPDTIPQGSIVHHNDTSRYPEGYFEQTYNFDFFNYAGIHRPVFLYTTPKIYVDDIDIFTTIDGTAGIISYSVTTGGSKKVHYGKRITDSGCSLKVYDNDGIHLTSAIGCVGTIRLSDAKLWWPFLMSETPGYLYTLKVSVSDENGTIDVYPIKVGIREMSWNSTTVMLNGKQLYLRGCGKHEDSDIRGKGVDNALIVKDFNLLKWLGANSFRTSHYPYAEEIMDMADKEGIMVIDECPAVGLTGFGATLLKNHVSVMKELVRRDKNRPSVIMWSVGNEPQSSKIPAKEYFKTVVKETHQSDPTRPVTCVLNRDMWLDLAADSLDVILVNRYFSWYSDTGHLELIQRQTETEFTEWHKLHNKPVMISEYGAGSLAGMHAEPAFTYTEEYQAQLMLNNFKAFDILRAKGFFFGEMIWNFADFATPQEHFRPWGCMKGMFTRARQPKMAAHLLRARYHSLSERNRNDMSSCMNLGIFPIV